MSRLRDWLALRLLRPGRLIAKSPAGETIAMPISKDRWLVMLSGVASDMARSAMRDVEAPKGGAP